MHKEKVMLSGLEKSALVIMVKQAAEVERIKKKKHCYKRFAA